MLGGYSTSASYDGLLPLHRIDLLEACFHYSSARPTYGWRCDLPEGYGSSFFIPNPGQVDGSSRTTPCLHFVLLDLRSKSFMFDFVRAEGDFLLWITVHPTRPWQRHAPTSPQYDFISAATPTQRSGAWETWIPMGPHRPGSQRSLPSGPDLPEAPPTCKWVRRPYPQLWRPWKTPEDLTQILKDPLGLEHKASYQITVRRCQ
jgi:hypothetical protein